MFTKFTVGVTVWMAASAGVCLAEGRTVVRGQSPAPAADVAYGPLIGSAPGYGQHAKHGKKDFKPVPIYNHNFGYDGGYWNAPPSHGVHHGGYGGADCDCPPGGYPHGHPSHHHTYSYKWPQNMVYPSPQVPAGMVQYPYYTLKGPSDFFMK